MSQAVMPETPTVPSAFARPPSTAELFQKQYAESPAAQAIQQPVNSAVLDSSQTPPQNTNQIIVPSARVVNSILPPQNRAQAQVQPQVATPPSASVGQPEETSSKPVPTPVAPTASDAFLQRQLDQERQAWANERAQWQAAFQQQNEMLQKANALQQEYNVLKQQAELNKQLSSDDLFANMTSVDADDARQLVQLTAQTLQAPLDTMRQEMQKQQVALQQQQQYINDQMARMYKDRAAQALYAAHPDFAQLVYDPGFTQFAQQRDGYTSRTREQAAWEEFNRGNSEYLIQMINEYKGQAPSVASLQTAPPVQVANSAVNAAPATPVAPRFTLAELNNLMQMRQISPDQYRIYLDEYRKLQSAQPPQ